LLTGCGQATAGLSKRGSCLLPRFLVAGSGGTLLSSEFTVSRAVVIQAPAETVYPLVANAKAWKDWSVWNRREPAMQMSYSGPPSGKGRKWAWKSKSEDNGRMVFTAADPNSQVDFDLHFDDSDAGLAKLKALAERK
jgi:uncharacterized protein YndB with AHSA1/START domain